MPRPSCQRILMRSPRRPRNTNRSPAWGSRFSPSWTCRASPFIPRRMSVRQWRSTPARRSESGSSAQRPDHGRRQFRRRQRCDAHASRTAKLDLDRRRRVQYDAIIAAVGHRRDDNLGKPAAGVAQLLPPAINLPGTNRRAPGDIGDNRARRKRRRDDRSLLLLTPRPAPLGPGENLDSAHPDVLCTSAAPMLAPVRTSGLNRSGGARRPSPEAYIACQTRTQNLGQRDLQAVLSMLPHMGWDGLTLKALVGSPQVVISGVLLLAGV